METKAATFTTNFVVFPDDCNYNNPPSIFGGKMLAEMDICAAMTARQQLYGTSMTDSITVGVDKVMFLRPAFIGDVVHLHGKITALGNKSLTIFVECFREDKFGVKEKMAQGIFTFVSRFGGNVSEHGLKLEE